MIQPYVEMRFNLESKKNNIVSELNSQSIRAIGYLPVSVESIYSFGYIWLMLFRIISSGGQFHRKPMVLPGIKKSACLRGKRILNRLYFG